MNLFIGNKNDAWWIKEVTSEIECTGEIKDIMDMPVIEKIYDAIIFNIKAYINPPEDVIKVADAIRKTQSSVICFIAPGFNSNSKILSKLQLEGFDKFVTGSTTTEKKEELRAILSTAKNFTPASAVNIAGQIDLPEIEEPAQELNLNKKTVGVIGAQSRIGTTTQSIQIIKYLNYIGYKACYIEVNSSGYLKSLQQLYPNAFNDTVSGCVKYMNINMYDITRINKALDADYDYYIYDYGNIETANKTSFFEKNIKILCSGIKPNEMFQSTQAIKELNNLGCFYIFSFVQDADKKDVLELMLEQRRKVSFADYAPEAFEFIEKSKTVYENIFKLVENKKTAPAEQKKSLLRFWRGKNE